MGRGKGGLLAKEAPVTTIRPLPRSLIVLALASACASPAIVDDDTAFELSDTGTSSDDTAADDTSADDTSADDTGEPALTAAEFLADEPSLIGWWPLDGDATDALGEYDGTATGTSGAVGADGEAGAALAFNGSATVDFGNVPVPTGSVSVSYWLNAAPTQGPGIGYRHLSKRAICTNGDFFDLQTSIGDDGSLRTGHEIRSQSSGTAPGVGATELATNTWYHLVLVLDAEAGASIAYVDGQEVDRADIVVAEGTTFSVANDGSLGIGTSPCIDQNSTLSRFVGTMDEIAVFSRALTADEVAALGRL